MNDMSENKTDLEELERVVAGATGSKATGRFAKLTFEAAMNLRAGLCRSRANGITG
jgi:hypothetical protein